MTNQLNKNFTKEDAIEFFLENFEYSGNDADTEIYITEEKFYELLDLMFEK